MKGQPVSGDSSQNSRYPDVLTWKLHKSPPEVTEVNGINGRAVASTYTYFLCHLYHNNMLLFLAQS